MSISSEITRISNAKTAIAESIANKGVTVPSGTKIDGMATLIDSIPTGGGSGDTSETWVLNESLNLINLSVSINFVSDNMSFIKFELFNGQRSITRAGDISAAGLNYYTTSQNRVTIDPSLTSWKTNPYRKVTFATAPTGDLLSWLQSNAVKQAHDTAVQPSKALTVTSNGTTTITPDAPYDAIKQVDLTVNVPRIDYNTIATTWAKYDCDFEDAQEKSISVTGNITGLAAVLCTNGESFAVFTLGAPFNGTAITLSIWGNLWEFNTDSGGATIIMKEQDPGGTTFYANNYIYFQLA